jgi:5-methylcytosine-specific restriction endonuclease McrA
VSSRSRKYDWGEIREFYESGHTVRECQQRFGFSNGAWHQAVVRGDVVTQAPPKPRGKTQKAVAELLAAGMSQTGIARALGISKPTVCFHMRMLGIPPNEDFGRRYDWDEIRAAYEAGKSMTDCMKQFGFSRNAWWDAIRRGVITPRPRFEPIESLLVVGRRRSRHHVKSRLLLEGLKQRRCERCGLTDWEGGSISLELHHVNGNGLDNRLENLLLLCPNCHSQTDTWGGRNKFRRMAA